MEGEIPDFRFPIPDYPISRFPDSMIAIHDTPAGATFNVKVHPRAKKNAITGEVGNAVKLALTAPPVEGRANQGCVEFLAKVLSVPRSSITIVAGETSRSKVVRVAGLSAEEVRKRISAADHAAERRFGQS
jgi:uncharacterized protein (TIGR00251 family)